MVLALVDTQLKASHKVQSYRPQADEKSALFSVSGQIAASSKESLILFFFDFTVPSRSPLESEVK